MGDSPRPSEGADASSAREDETPGVSSESPEQSWAQQVTDAQTQEESEEVMEVGYAEAAETLCLPRLTATLPSLISLTRKQA